MLNKEEYEEYLNTTPDEKKRDNIAVNLKMKKEFKEYEEKTLDKTKHQEFIRERHLPKFIPFVNLEENDDE